MYKIEELYTLEMFESIKKVEQTRNNRISDTYEKLNEKQKEELLNTIHPDYKEDSFTKIKAGANKGEKAPIEVAEILHANSMLSNVYVDVNAPHYETDVLVIGGGGGGACAAIEAKKAGANVLIATKLRMGDSNTVMAETGMQAATKENDSPQQHYLDAYVVGKFKAKPDILSHFVTNAPETVKWLNDLGVAFTKNEDGSMTTAHGVDTSRKRLHLSGRFIGMEIMRVLRDEINNLQIPILEFSPAIELIKDDNGNVAGAVLLNMLNGEHIVVRSKAVIIATGGSGRLHHAGLNTNNHYGATADGVVLAYRAGASLIDQDSHQYTATGIVWPTAILGVRLIDVFRTIGAGLCNANGQQFVNSKDARDIVGASIIKECTQNNGGIQTINGPGVWLDFPMLDIIHGEGFTEKNISVFYQKCMQLGIDVTKYPILVYPISDYQNGGIEIEVTCATTKISNLFAAGEVAGGLHGRDRIPGNSLTDVLVFGRQAGKHAAQVAKNISLGNPNLNHVNEYNNELIKAGINATNTSPILLPKYSNVNKKPYMALL